MLTKAYIDEFQEKYRNNCLALNEWSDRLFEKMDQEAWIELLSRRSKELRRLFQEDEALLSQLWQSVSDKPSREEADALFDLTVGLFRGGVDDVDLIIRLCRTLLPIYEKWEDVNYLIPLYHMLGNEYAIFFRLVKDEKKVELVFENYRKCIALRDRYAEIENPQNRVTIFYAYYNLIMFLGHFEKASFAECFEICKEMRAFADSEVVRTKDGCNQVFCQDLEETFLQTYMVLLFKAKVEWPFDERTKAVYQEFQKTILMPLEREGKLDPRSRHCMRLLNGDVGEREWLDQYYQYVLSTIPKIDFTTPDAEAMLPALLECYVSAEFYLDCVKKAALSEEERQKMARPVVRKGNEIGMSIPYLYQTQMANSFLAEWFSYVEPFLTTREEKIQFLKNFLLRRQPITYIHSLMVSRLATEIAEAVIEKAPETLVDILGLENAAQVRAEKEELQQYVSNSGLLHDIGKCYITDVINRQSRALSDDEFRLIKRHPELGLKVVNNSEKLSAYYDVIMGHHKSYDGKSGYPAGFDNKHSKIRILIDLITIADSIDAATDILGRNYSEGKTFLKVLEELQAGAGTRYNPTLVKLIQEDEDLIGRLSDLTREGRYEVYRQVFEEINP